MGDALLESPMSKQKPKRPNPEKDVFLRLPPEYGELLRKIKAKTLRATTVETQIALERRAKALGIPFTPNYPEDI